MAILTINLRTNSDDANDLALQGFPFMAEQFIISESNGDACVVEIDLGERDDTTAAQEQYLDTNPAVIGYGVTAQSLHNEA